MARRWRLVSVTPAGSPKSWMTDPQTGRQVPDPSAGVTERASAVIETDLDIGRSLGGGSMREIYVGDELPEGSITDLSTSGVTIIPPTEGAEFTVPIGAGEQFESRETQRGRYDDAAAASVPYDEYHGVDVMDPDVIGKRAAIFERWREEQGLDEEEANRLWNLRTGLETEKERQRAAYAEQLEQSMRAGMLSTFISPAPVPSLAMAESEGSEELRRRAADLPDYLKGRGSVFDEYQRPEPPTSYFFEPRDPYEFEELEPIELRDAFSGSEYE